MERHSSGEVAKRDALNASEFVTKQLNVRSFIVRRMLETHESWALYGGLAGIVFTLLALLSGVTFFKWFALGADVIVVFMFWWHLPTTSLPADLELDVRRSAHTGRDDVDIVSTERHCAIVEKIKQSAWLASWNDGDEYSKKKYEQVLAVGSHLRTALSIKLAENKDFRNEPKVALSTEPDWVGKDNDKLPRLERTDYYTSFLTNQLFRFNLVYSFHGANNAKSVLSKLDLIPSQLSSADLSDSLLANNIGITVLVLDADGLVLLAKQNTLAQVNSSVGRLVPIGNGSLDPQDMRPKPRYDGRQTVVNLDATLKAGACREFCEEGITADPDETLAEVIQNARFLGYWKWESHGYKPEFCYLSRTSKLRKDFTPARNELDMQLAAVQIKTRIRSHPDVELLCSELEKRSNECSTPLLAAIALLRLATDAAHPCYTALCEAWSLSPRDALASQGPSLR